MSSECQKITMTMTCVQLILLGTFTVSDACAHWYTSIRQGHYQCQVPIPDFQVPSTAVKCIHKYRY